MIELFKNIKIINLITNFFIFVIITSIFINKVHQMHLGQIQPYEKNGVIEKNEEDSILYVINEDNTSLKKNFSEYLTDKTNYFFYFDRNCVVSDSNEDRKRVRWVLPYLYYNLYNQLNFLGDTGPYYTHILLFSVILFFAYLLIFKTFSLGWEYKFVFLFYLTFVFQNPIAEYQFTIIETFLMTVALFASRYKKFKIFVTSVILAQLNRESGFLLGLLWLVFNDKEINKLIIAVTLSALVFIIFNFKIIDCLINPDFFVSSEYHVGQFNFSDVGKTLSYASFLKLMLLNFFIPFGSIFYILFTTKNKNMAILILTCIYLVVFIVVIPWQHIIVRLLLLPLFISSIYFKNLEIKNN